MTTQSAERQAANISGGNGLRSLVREAWAVTDVVADQVEPSTREAAFKLVLEAMLRDGTPPVTTEVDVVDIDVHELEPEPIEIDDVDIRERESAPDSIDVSLATPEQRAWAIADYLRLGVEQTLCLYDVTSSAPEVRAPAVKLSADHKEAVRDLTLLVTAGRSAIGIATGTEDIRCAAVARDLLRKGELVSILEAIDEIAVRGSPNSVNRLVRLRGVGVEAARIVAARVVGV